MIGLMPFRGAAYPAESANFIAGVLFEIRFLELVPLVIPDIPCLLASYDMSVFCTAVGDSGSENEKVHRSGDFCDVD